MPIGGRPGAAWKNKFLEGVKTIVEMIQPGLKPEDVVLLDRRAAWNAEVTAKIKQQLLDFLKAAGEVVWDGLGQDQTQAAVEFVKFAHQSDARGIFLYSRTIGKTCGAIIAGPRIDSSESMSHD
jgi:hypothetical protein